MSERAPDRMRDVSIEPFATAATGSVVIAMGQTRVLCTASVQDETPRWIKKDESTGEPLHGWVTAEYAMLPGSTVDRKRRGPDGRGTEIQRLIGRSLRAGVDLDAMPGLAVTCDCDVLQADGGTRTAAITGAYVALVQALRAAEASGRLAAGGAERALSLGAVAAVSVGVVDGVARLDLDYALDVRAEVDMNVVMRGSADAAMFVEVQGTGEKGTFDRARLGELLDLAERGIGELMRAQRDFLDRL